MQGNKIENKLAALVQIFSLNFSKQSRLYRYLMLTFGNECEFRGFRELMDEEEEEEEKKKTM